MRKINYVWAKEYDLNTPNNGFAAETEHIITDGVYDFSDWLNDNGVQFEEENDIYFVLNNSGDRTGEAFMIVSEEETDEELVW